MSLTESAQASTEAFTQLLAEQVTYWQEILRVQDWNIEVRVVRAHEFPGDKTPVAQTEIFEWRKDAIMRFMHPMDTPIIQSRFLFGEEKDYDLCIVHELLHLSMVGFDPDADSPKNVYAEQHIEAVSRALVKLHRAGAQAGNLPPLGVSSAVADGHVGRYL